MGQKIAIGGYQNSGKSFGRRYIPDGENVMLIAPSIKTSHLFESLPGIENMSTSEIDELIKKGKRKPVKPFDAVDPGGKYKNIDEAILLPSTREKQNVEYFMNALLEKKKLTDYGATEAEQRKHIKGNIMLCDDLNNLQLYMAFVNKFMPWIHTIILPDFTHYITEVITSAKFLARKNGNEAFARYTDLAADSLRSFIKYADVMRREVVVITEFHVEWDEAKSAFVIFTPGGRLLTEKFKPSSYYDTFLFTDVKHHEDEEEIPDYRYVTRNVARYPEARTIGDFPDLYIPNNLQEVLTKVRQYNGIELTK